MSFNTNEEAVNILCSEILKARNDNPFLADSIEFRINGEVIDVRGDLIDKEQIQRVIDDSMPDGINEAFGVARAARVREEQRQMNASMTGLIDNISKTKDFDEWFDNYSFKYIPSFAKPLIKQWVKAAYFAALGEVK